MKRIRYIFLITILLLPFLVNAETEFDDPGKIGGSISLDATKSFFKIIEINLMEEIRLKDDFKKIERFSTTLDLSYKPNRYVVTGVGYNLINKTDIDEVWDIRHRFYYYTTGIYKLYRLKLSVRERAQCTWRPGVHSHKYNRNPEWFLRSRFELDYSSPYPVDPYASIELFTSLNKVKSYDQNRFRVIGGVKFHFSRKILLRLYYRYSNERYIDDDPTIHMIGIGASYTL